MSEFERPHQRTGAGTNEGAWQWGQLNTNSLEYDGVHDATRESAAIHSAECDGLLTSPGILPKVFAADPQKSQDEEGVGEDLTSTCTLRNAISGT
jgi:hypothetical protein